MIPAWVLFAVFVGGQILWLAGSMLADVARWYIDHLAWRRIDRRRADVAQALQRRPQAGQ